MGRLPWAIAGAAVVAITAILILSSSTGGRRHPDPRPGITAEGVLAAASYAGYDRIVRSYEAWMAAEMHRQGKSLAEIRRAVDAQFGS